MAQFLLTRLPAVVCFLFFGLVFPSRAVGFRSSFRFLPSLPGASVSISIFSFSGSSSVSVPLFEFTFVLRSTCIPVLCVFYL